MRVIKSFVDAGTREKSRNSRVGNTQLVEKDAGGAGRGPGQSSRRTLTGESGSSFSIKKSFFNQSCSLHRRCRPFSVLVRPVSVLSCWGRVIALIGKIRTIDCRLHAALVRCAVASSKEVAATTPVPARLADCAGVATAKSRAVLHAQHENHLQILGNGGGVSLPQQ